MNPILASLAESLPGAYRHYQRFGDRSLAELSRDFNGSGPPPTETLRRAVRRRVTDLYGPEAAEAAEAKLERGEGLLAANHHGLDCHPEMVQGALLCHLDPLMAAAAGRPAGPLIILACGTVPLSNPTSPGGLLLGRRGDHGRLVRWPLFPRSFDGCQVGLAPPLGRDRLTALAGRLSSLELHPPERRALTELVENYLLNPDFLNRPDFPGQAAWFNQALFKARVRGLSRAIYLELEAVVGDCLKEDFFRPDSPIGRLMAEKRLRGRLLEKLAGQTGCWSPRLLRPELSRSELADSGRPLGTVLFWEIDSRGRRYSMTVTGEGERGRLVGPTLSLPLTPEALATALAEKRLRPGLFLDYLVLGAHGLRTYGGVFMVDYLPKMMAAASEILETPLTGPDRPALLAAGPQACHRPWPEKTGGPLRHSAGAVEFLAAGPLDEAALRAIGGLKLADISPFSLGESYQEETPLARRLPNWLAELRRLQAAGRGFLLDY